uniref:Ig-like domain-containing protein n=1 Tax=Denticeps clupeoides TaxID=299321 RepID=A0AAY4EWH7_9TELE
MYCLKSWIVLSCIHCRTTIFCDSTSTSRCTSRHRRYFYSNRERKCPTETEMKLKDLSWSKDAGRYSCEVSNEVGSDACNANVSILEPPYFTEQLEPMDVTAGDAVCLRCQVMGTPEIKVSWFKCHMTGSLPIKVTWSKDHKDIRSGGNFKISCVDNTAHLTIVKADKSDSGRYSCHASNDIGKDSCSSEVLVKGIWLIHVTVFRVCMFLTNNSCVQQDVHSTWILVHDYSS